MKSFGRNRRLPEQPRRERRRKNRLTGWQGVLPLPRVQGGSPDKTADTFARGNACRYPGLGKWPDVLKKRKRTLIRSVALRPVHGKTRSVLGPAGGGPFTGLMGLLASACPQQPRRYVDERSGECTGSSSRGIGAAAHKIKNKST